MQLFLCWSWQAMYTVTHKKKLHKWILPSYLSSCPLQIVSPSRLNRTHCMEFRQNMSKCIIWEAFNPDNINWQSFIHLRFLKFIKTLVKINLLKLGLAGLSKVATCRRKLPPTWLISADYSAWHFFTGGIFKMKYHHSRTRLEDKEHSLFSGFLVIMERK